MEKLKSVLKNYNISHKEECYLAPWNTQFCNDTFPYYWTLTFNILNSLNRNNLVIEIGCGLGAVTSILCYQGYTNILSFERDPRLANMASTRLKELFGRTGIVLPVEYPSATQYNCDILILVNCSYGDHTNSKKEYKESLCKIYNSAGKPRYFILEVIDDSYILHDDEFPEHIRLNKNDIMQMFPSYSIKSWATYKYPINGKCKTLYLIERI